MAYNIQYSQQFHKKYPSKKGCSGKLKRISVIVLILCVGVLLFELYRNGILKELLIPGDAEVTVAALETLSDNLKNGIPLKEAVTAFCVEIIEHGNVY